MSWRRAWKFSDVSAAHLALLSAAAELVLREAYHRISTESIGIFVVAVVWIGVLVASLVRARARDSRTGRGIGRLAVLLAVATTLYVLAGPATAVLASHVAWRYVVMTASAIALVGAALWALAADDNAWTRARRVLVMGCVLFMTSQLVFSALRAPWLVWPPVGQAAQEDSRRTATVFLLLDELNAKSAEPLVELLRRQGLTVRAKPIATVGDSTRKVIPEMFSGLRFEQAKPCGTTAICGVSNVLDFARISASRPDVDVVGFFHPYCAIRGLRTCERLPIRLTLLDADRWLCAMWRRTGIPTDLPASRCNGVYNRAWADLLRETIDALWRAPVWREGGFLFAHVPLPHPPGADVDGSLQSHYQDNVNRAILLVADMLPRVHASGLELRLVIFSDHPLRQVYWCTHHIPYATSGCAPHEAFQDEQVPLIIAGERLPALEAITTNAQVFNLAATWR